MNKDFIIYEDNDIIVCHKKAGIATEGARVGRTDLVSEVRNYLARSNRSENGKRAAAPYVATVHRLDQPVEGVLVMAKTKKAATDIAAQIKNRTTDKYYYALCMGILDQKEGHLSNLLTRRKEDNTAAVLSPDEKNQAIISEAKKAELDYKVIAEKDGCSLLEIKLGTGRFHQIRVQLSYLGHPILGDSKYGSEASIELSKQLGIKNVSLICYRFGFKHPSTKKKVEFKITPSNEKILEMLECSI
ncbi:RluA family pseudouridine synthase [Butyrivibrio proteoclasticus]|uniref:RluA family pseudouridine synthase n=1 Tax=Butyrivibrio proteoclasticus TaxID=43305 RepID=UPI00054F1374|nr:RluA family pseudouridine synthase [Butyrivibrio proteoclasticus]